MKKTIIFDIGGVMASEDNLKEHYLPLCKNLTIDKQKFFDIRDKYINKAATGQISGKKMILLISKELNINYKKLLKKWINYKIKSIRKNLDLEKIIKKLKKQGYHVGSLSSVIDIHQKIGKEKKLYDVFNFNIYSFKTGFSKPDINIYKFLLKKLKLKPQDVIIIDDMQVCLNSAKKLGIKTVLFKNNKQLIKDLKKLKINY